MDRWTPTRVGKSGATGTDAPLKLPIPLHLIVLDGVGALLFALGIAERLGQVPLLSRLVAVPDIDLIAIVAGGIIMAVAMVGIVRAALEKAKAARQQRGSFPTVRN